MTTKIKYFEHYASSDFEGEDYILKLEDDGKFVKEHEWDNIGEINGKFHLEMNIINKNDEIGILYKVDGTYKTIGNNYFMLFADKINIDEDDRDEEIIFEIFILNEPQKFFYEKDPINDILRCSNNTNGIDGFNCVAISSKYFYGDNLSINQFYEQLNSCKFIEITKEKYDLYFIEK